VAAQSIDEVGKQISQFVGGLTLKQRALIVGGVAMVAATLWFFVHVLGTAEQKTLYSGLKPADAQGIASKLAAKSIVYEISADGGSIQVPADQLDRARMETASQGLPRNARLGFEIFDTPNWLGTEFTEKVNYQRALEGELERTIQTMGEVEAVRVHLVMPSESLFSEREREGKAAVIVKARGIVSPEKQFAIAQLVSSAVDKLSPENVTVLDAETARPMHQLEPGSAGGTGLGEQLSQQLVATLEPVVGEGKVRATVRVEYDSSSFEDTQETYDPKSAVAVSVQKSEETSGVGGTGGIPGTAANIPGSQVTAQVKASGGDQQSSRSEAGTYVVSKSVRHLVQPAGRVRRVTAAVLVDDATETATGSTTPVRRKRTPEEIKNFEQLASAAVGLDTARGDVLAVENLSFHDEKIEAPAAPTRVERMRVVISRWSSLLRYAAVGLLFLAVYFAMLRPIKKQMLTAFKELPARLSAKGGALKAAGEAELLTGGAGGPEGQRVSGLKKQLAERIKVEPAAATKLVQSWIRENGQ
jgi:flagellar M-ring protein FliF